MTTPDFPNGSLEKMGINVETPIDENVLTENSARNVRFRSVKVPGVAKGLGYSFSEVDKFVQEIVIPSLKWYQRTLHERDREVYSLGEALDELETVKTGLENQIKSFQYNSTIKEGLTAYKEDKEFQTLLTQYQDLQKEYELLKNQLASEGQPGVPVPVPVPDVDLQEYVDAIEERDQYITQITDEYTKLEQQNVAAETKISELETLLNTQQEEGNGDNGEETEALRDQISELQEQVQVRETKLQEYETHINTITDQYNQLSTAYAAAEQFLAKAPEYEAQTEQLQEVLETKNRLETELVNALSEITVLQNQNNELASQPPTVVVDTEQLEALQKTVETQQEQYNTLLVAYQTLENTVNTSNTVDNSELEQLRSRVAEYETYATDVTNKYNELMEAYQSLQEQIPTLNAMASSGGGGAQDNPAPISEPELEQLYAYIETIREQYSALLDAYNEVAQNTTVSTNNAELGELKVELEASRAEIVRLQELVDEYEAAEVEEERVLPAIPLLTDKKQNVPLPPQFSNLPPGIRPEDLV